MSDKPQLGAPSITRERPLRRKVARVWGSWAGSSWEENLQEMDVQSIRMLRSWLVYDSMVEAGSVPRRVNWNSVLGLALATAVSLSIWAGIGLMIAHVWK